LRAQACLPAQPALVGWSGICARPLAHLQCRRSCRDCRRMTRALRSWMTLVSGLAVFGAFIIAAPSAHATDAPLLTEIGEHAITDLRGCLSSRDALDVYYLIDASGSLADTDPTNIRSELIANSLRQLADLQQ